MWVERNGKTWRIREQIGETKVDLATGYPTKSAAKDAMALMRTDELRGEALVPNGGRTLLNDFLDAWEPLYLAGLKPSAALSEGGRLRNHIRPLLGHLPLEDIDPLMVQRWAAQLKVGNPTSMDPPKLKRVPLVAKTLRNCHGLLYKVMSAAVGARLIRANPCADTAKTLPKGIRKEMRFLNDPEIARLLTHVPPHWRPLVLLLVGTGLRWGEAIGLRIQDVDLLAQPPKLKVLRHLHQLSGVGLVFTEPKSEASRRSVSFTVQIALALTPLWSGRDRAELVFRAPMGGPVLTRNFRRGWVKWTKAAGLEGLRIHDLRHSHAAILISANRSLTAVQRRMGHSSIAVTSDLYGHLREEVDEGILSAIDSALSGVSMVEVAEELAGV